MCTLSPVAAGSSITEAAGGQVQAGTDHISEYPCGKGNDMCCDELQAALSNCGALPSSRGCATCSSVVHAAGGVTQQLTGTSMLPPQDDWLRRAELAVSKGEDELAREALKKRKAYQVRRSSLGCTWQQQACAA